MNSAELRDAIKFADAEINAALWAGDMDLANTLAGRKIGWRVVLGELTVKLKKSRL